MRPKKERWVRCLPGERSFIPKPIRFSLTKECVCLTMDEIEAMRLADFEQLSQIQVARRMRVHRSTISRILASAHYKVADALVHIKPLKVSEGCCKFVGTGNLKCPN